MYLFLSRFHRENAVTVVVVALYLYPYYITITNYYLHHKFNSIDNVSSQAILYES